MVTVIQRSHTVLLPSLHLLPSRFRDQQTEPEVKAPQCQTLCLLPPVFALQGTQAEHVRPLENDVAQGDLRPFPLLKTAMLQPRTLLWKALGLGPINI